MIKKIVIAWFLYMLITPAFAWETTLYWRGSNYLPSCSYYNAQPRRSSAMTHAKVRCRNKLSAQCSNNGGYLVSSSINYGYVRRGSCRINNSTWYVMSIDCNATCKGR
jgi:hypothetical protein